MEEEKKKKKKQVTTTEAPTQLFKLNTVNLPEPSTVKKTTETKQTTKKSGFNETRSESGGFSKEDEEDERKWFQKGAFEDGYDFGDVTKTILGTFGDVKENLGTGIIGMGEKVVDALATVAPYVAKGQFYQNGGAYQSVQTQKMFDESIEQSKPLLKEFVKKDLYDEEKIAKKLLSDPYKKIGIDTEESSVLGEKSDSLVQSAGQLGATIGLQAVGVPWFVTTGLTSFGSEAENALNQGASFDEASASALISAGAEILFEKLGGIKFGGTALDDRLLEPLTKRIASKGLKLLTTVGVKGAFESGEEVFSQFISNLGSSLYKEENLKDILISEEALDEYLESAIGGFVLGGAFGTVESLIETPELTENEQKVVDKIVEERVAEQENVTARQKAKIREEVIAEMDKGYLSIDTIEEVLGGDTYKAYKNTVDSEEAMFKEYEELTKEYNELGEKTGATLAEQSRYNELKQITEEKKQQILGLKDTSQRFNLKDKLGSEVMSLVQNDRLAESYNERGRRGQAFEADLSKYDAKQGEVIKRAAESGILNNTNRTHEFVDMIAKISADKGVLFDFTNNQKLQESGFVVDNADVNGFVTKDGITLNIDSKKALNSTVGHEITHVLEGTEFYDALQQTIFEYAKSKGDYQGRYDAISKLYANVEGANVDAELTADLVGDYLFTDPDFIHNLSTNHRNVFQKVWDEVKYLCKVATAGSKEARELAKVQKAFADAYRAEGKKGEVTAEDMSEADTKYSVSDNDYRKAVESGDVVRAQEMVDEAAKKAGYVQAVFHGTDEEFNKFDRNIAKQKAAEHNWLASYPAGTIFLASNRSTASVYGNRRLDLYLDTTGMKTFTHKDMYAAHAMDELHTGDISKYPVIAVEGSDATIYATLSGTRVKRTDAAIYDDNGDLIPLSKRFNKGNSDMRYSLSDSDGKQLTKEQNEYFKDSKMRDDDGNLMVMYHGSQDAGFHVFDPKMSDDDTSFFFVDRNDVAASYSGTTETYEAKTIRTAEDMNKFLAEIGYDHYEAVERNGRFELLENNEFVAAKDTMQELYEEFCWYEGVGEGDANYKVYLNLTNPLVVDAEGRNWNNVSREFSQEVYDRYQSLTAEEKEALVQIAAWEDMSIFRDELRQATDGALASAYEKLGGEDANMYDMFTIASDNFSEEALREFAVKQLKTRDYAARAKEQGYDGVIFKNIHDNGGYSNGSEGASTVAIAFDSNQIKSVANEKPTSDPDIRYSLSEYSEEEKQAHNKAVVDHFGKTYNWAETGYVLLDGTKLDLSGKHEGAPGGYRTVDHRDIVDALGSDYGGDSYSGSLVQFMSEGNIRISPESDGINLSVKPTKAQEQALSSFISRARGEVLLDIDDFDGYTVVSVEYPRGTHANKVLNDIREWFDNGTKPETSSFSQYRSLSERFTTPETYGKYNVYGKDVRLEEAPVQAPVEEVAPVKPVAETTAIPEGFAPVSEEEAARMASESLDSLTDADMPPEVEAPYYGKTGDNTPADPFLDRDIGEVGNRKVKAYMYENPEVKPFFQAEAEVMLGELQNTTKGEKWYNDQLYYESGGENGWGGTKRYTSDDIAYLLDERHYTYEQIEKGLKAIIEDDGAENNAVSKRIEFLLNDRLRKGYTDFNTGMDIPANQDYIKLLNEKQITEYNEKAFNTLVADENVPPIAEESTATEDIAPMAEEPVAEEPVAEPEEQPEQIARIRKADPKKDGWWSRTKKTFNEAVSQLGDKGWVFENLSKKTGNREVEAKYDFMKNRSKGMAQEYINEHLLPIYEKVQEMGKGKEVAPVVEVNGDTVTDYMEQLDYYARHLLNIDRMSLETEAERVRRGEIRKQFEGYTERQIQSIASERITQNTPEDRVKQIYLAQEYVDLGGAKGKNKPVFGSSVSADVSRQRVAEYEAAHPEFKEVEQAILEYNAQLRQFAVNQGLIKQSVADKWAKMYPHYVPIRRTDKQGASVSVPLDSNRTGVNNPFKRAQGGNSDFMPLLETMALNTEQIFRAVHRNEFGKELMGALETAAAMDAEKSVDGATRQAVNAGELTAGTRVKAHDRDNIGTVKSFNPKTGKYTVFFENQQGQSATVELDAKILTPLGNWKADNGKEVDASEVLEGTEENDNAVLTPSQNGQNPKFTVFVKGKAVTFDITEEMYKAMQPAEGILSETYAIPNKIASGYKSVLTQLDPFFALYRNPFKDTKDVFFNSQHAAKTYITAGTTFKELITKGNWYKEFIKHGGKTESYYDTKTQSFMKKDGVVKKIVGFPWRAYNQATEKVEMFWRLSEYIASRKMGRSIEVSMLDAARVTTNFGAGGDLTKWANRNGAMFLNPSVQGVMQIGRNVREAYHGGLKGSAILAAKVMATGLSGLFFNWLLWDDDEDYEELSDYVKQNYFIVYKTEDGKFIRIPKGRMEAVIQNGFEQMQNLITGDDEVDMATFADLVANNLAPNNPFEDNLLAPVKQAFTNTTWYGEDLVPTRLQDLPAAEQFDETTDSVSKWIGEHTNTSPYKWNYVMQQYGGGFADMVLPMLTEEAEGSDFLAPIKDQIVSDGLMKNQSVSDFYDKRDELTVNANSSKATEEDVLMNKYMNSINSELAELYAKKREIQNSDLSDAEKYEQVREIQSQIVDLTRESLNTYDDIHYQSARDGEYSNIGDRYFKLDDDGEWQKLSDDQVTKYKVTSAAGDAPYATDGTNHYRWYVPGEDAKNQEQYWRKLDADELKKQNEVTKGLGISAEEYWGNKDEYDYAYKNPEKYKIANAIGGYETYQKYKDAINDIEGEKDANGETIRGTQKENRKNYIFGLDIPYGERLILYRSEYDSQADKDEYNNKIVEYLNGRNDISYEEEVEILEALGMTVDSRGNVDW